MSSTYIIETRLGAAGIVVRDGRGFRFFAAQRAFTRLDGHLFATPRAAEAAARDCLFPCRHEQIKEAALTNYLIKTIN
jgi:hypothetical protein